MKNYTAFFLAALMIPATALYAQGRGGKNKDTRGLISLQWLRLRAPTAAGTGLIPGQEI